MLLQKKKKKRLVKIAKKILGRRKRLKAEHVVLSVDESHWDLRPRVGGIWLPPGEQLALDIPENKEDSFTIFGALNLQSDKFIYKIVPWGYACYFREFLYQIAARYKDKQIHLILDKASIHTAGIIQEFKQRYPNFHFHFLLARGSEVNPIERFWRFSKDKTKKGASFQRIQDLYHAVRRFFWHYGNKGYRYHVRSTVEKLANAS
jgi:hypothetical protein